jgi:hypothetical protein
MSDLVQNIKDTYAAFGRGDIATILAALELMMSVGSLKHPPNFPGQASGTRLTRRQVFSRE